MKLDILVLCTYPIDTPRHGGQIRVSKIVNHYRQAGFQVEVVGVLGSDNYPVSAGFEPSPPIGELAKILENPFLMEDVAISQLYESHDQYFSNLAKQIKKVPGLIHVEQPWLFGFAQRYIKEKLSHRCRLIYGSQNIEYQLKAAILKSYFTVEQVVQCEQQVKQLEMRAVTEADGVVCVSQHDLEWLRRYTQKPIVLAPNGVSEWQVTEQGIDEANQVTCHQKFALFCASGHPPNVKGFFDLFGGGFGAMNNSETIVIAGGASTAIGSGDRVHQSAKLAARITLAGLVSDSCLSGLLHTAHCIVLPITQGGGTNLKTAEALWSGRHIVATTTAMRGFEVFIGQQGVHVTNNPAIFKQQLRKVMAAPPLELNQLDHESRAIVLWEQCLKPLSLFITKIAQEQHNEG